MEWNQETLQSLSVWLLNTLSPLADTRLQAEASLFSASRRPEYALTVFRLVSEPSVDQSVCQAAVVNFKNHLHVSYGAIPHPDKDEIISLIVPLMLSSSPRIQMQLVEVLAVISKHDFVKLLPKLVSELEDASTLSNYASINGLLRTADSIFDEKFRFQYVTDDLCYCLNIFAAPLLDIFLKNARLIDVASGPGGTGNAETLRPLFDSQRLCCRIFYSLNSEELPVFFEDHMCELMTEFQKYLVTTYPVLENTGLDDLRSAVCEIINLYMEKNPEEFQIYIQNFATAVCSLLSRVAQHPSRDGLAIKAIEFLTTVSRSVHHAFFAGEGVIQHICQTVVIPNVRLREDDEVEELFNNDFAEFIRRDYVEFIRRDMERTEVGTKRRKACELLKGIATKYKAQVTSILSAQIQNLLNSFSVNPVANWKDKDCAIYLVVSLATKRVTGGPVPASTNLIDIWHFFTNVIVPELQSQNVNEFPMIKSGALKLSTVLRNHVPKVVGLRLFRDLVRFLTSESNVVHSYAAICIEKLLLVKDEYGRARYASGDIGPVLLVMMNNLFDALTFPESEENNYIMKCVMRVLEVAYISRDVAKPCIAGLTSVLNEVCKNPKNPVFNRYFLDSMAILIRRACERDSSLLSTFEESLLPSLETILLARRPPIPDIFMQIIEILIWRKSCNVPALVCLLRAFLQKAPHELNREGTLTRVLGICKGLVESSSTEEQGFYVLNTVIESLDYGVIATYMAQIWYTLFTRLQQQRSVKFIKPLLIFMSLLLVKHGLAKLVDSINAVQAGIFVMFVEGIWIPYLKLITGTIEQKLTAVAATKLLCECPLLLDAAAVELWGKLLDSIVSLLSWPEDDRVKEEPENVGYTAAFVSLYSARKKEDDPLKDIRDPKEFLVAALARLSTLSPGKYPKIITETLDESNRAMLAQFCNSYNCQIV